MEASRGVQSLRPQTSIVIMTIALGPLMIVPGRGISYEVQAECRNLGKLPNCKVTFDKSNNETVLKFGSFGHGECESNPDIAGIGVLIGLTPNFLLCLFAVWVISIDIVRVYRGTWKLSLYRTILFYKDSGADGSFAQKVIPRLVLSISDTATLLGLAYYFNFMLAAKCDISTYHYYVAIDTILFTCATTTLAALLSHAYYWRSLAALVRFPLALAHFLFVGLLLFYQAAHAPRLPEWLPPAVGVRNDSAVLLPVSCFLDRDLLDHWSPFRSFWEGKHTAAQRERIGASLPAAAMPEFGLYVMLLLCFVATHASHAVRCWRSRRRRRQGRAAAGRAVFQTARRGRLGTCFAAFWILAVCVCIAADCMCVYHALALRSWVHASGWMTGGSVNPENDVGGLGQLVAVFGLGAVVLAMLEPYGWDRVRGWKVPVSAKTSEATASARSPSPSPPLPEPSQARTSLS